MKKTQTGFTLIELVVVIVILGILAATALPRFIDLSTEASTSAAAGIAGGISSAAAINYAGRKAGAATGVAYVAAAPCGAAAINTIMQSPVDATNYTYAVSATSPISTCAPAANDGLTVSCTVTPTKAGATVATATVICAQ